MEINYPMPSLFSQSDALPDYLEEMIDEAVQQDFVKVVPLTAEDRNNDMYKAINFSFSAGHVEILYEKVVYSSDTQSQIIPHKQFLFGFRPTDGLCIFSQKQTHKDMLCDGPIMELATQCPLTQSLQYILVPWDQFKVWSYIPTCCDSHETCSLKMRPLELRRDLFTD
jgi:hypothetical protein